MTRAARTLFENQTGSRTLIAEIDWDQECRRFIQDVLTRASAQQWERHAAVFESARPQPGDFLGQATVEDLARLDRRNAKDAARCRMHAALLRDDDLLDPKYAADVALITQAGEA